ncbi:NAD(P)/FAD-dependent oxidoreductase [Actinosynnema sp. NPDC059335]|uniref:NAD(P)/FAD-dependent oxidoreductase n=1 Tax=Actinosynnema sp. NPDC059335 TaxID=3346804 RepID=UPI00366B9255
MDVVIAGGGAAGLAAALALADDGHRVVVLERGSAPPPGPAARAGEVWRRPTSPQSRHAHTLTSFGVAALRGHAPALLADLLSAGASTVDLTTARPPGEAVPGDAELVALACRRSTFDVVLHRHVAARPGVDLRYGTRVTGLDVTGGRVTGARVGAHVVPADLVLDATGRRAAGRQWSHARGVAPAAVRTGPTSVAAYVRFYRRRGPFGPLNRGNAAGVLADHYAGVLHPGDNGTFSVAFGVLPQDDGLRALRDPEVFDAVGRVTPWVGDWLDDAVPLGDVRVMTCPPNAFHAPESSPTGLVAVGDAVCVTDPLFGRGVSLALAHGFALAGLVRAHAVADLGAAAAALADELLLPWFRQACEEGEDRIARWRASVAGTAADRPPTALRAAGAAAAASRDPELWRGVVRVLMGLDRPDALTAPPFADRVRRALAAGPPLPPPGLPDRSALLAVAARAGRRARVDLASGPDGDRVA